MASTENPKEEFVDGEKKSEKVLSVDQKDNPEELLVDGKPEKKIKRQATQEQLKNPFHGVKLKQILECLVDFYGWEYLGERVNIRCFQNNPTMKSSLGFLRRTTWAREHVEDVYLEMLEDKEKKE